MYYEDELETIIKRINPGNQVGKLVLMTRFGKKNIKKLNNLIEWVVLFHVTTKDLPKKVQVIITSEENSYGVLDKKWIEGSELNHELDTSDPTFYQ